ncbi:MarR family winged helix-turn-helix transcriptional regulator [Nioella nitratireducens]|uniref:MarR family winged helix-turn-helix transcriptional regulator n=1 Tax=Nioella nitratireducens TaxID=1287720 RepID=UPI0008FD1B57|nr:MarR family transcriptional regulator [Nioella nitratireducens]
MVEIYNMAGHLIRRLNQISVAVFADHMAALGVELTPVQFAALSAIDTRPGIAQAELAGTIAYDQTTLGGVIDRLQQKGLVQREISPTDRRARVLTVTGPGRALLDRIRPEVRALQDDILSGLDEGEKDHLLRLLKKTTDAGNDKSRAPLSPRKTR